MELELEILQAHGGVGTRGLAGLRPGHLGSYPPSAEGRQTARGDDQSLSSSEEGQFGENVQLLPFLNTSAGSSICSTKRNLQRRGGWGSMPGLGGWAQLQGRAAAGSLHLPFTRGVTFGRLLN